MTKDEAAAALAANSAALVLAGRDVDTLIAALGSASDPPVQAQVKAFRESLVGADAPTRLVLTTAAIQTFGAIVQDREQARADAMAFLAQQRSDQARMKAEYERRQASRDVAYRTFAPIFSAIRARLLALEMALTDWRTAADLAAAQQALEDAFASAASSIAVGASGLTASL